MRAARAGKARMIVAGAAIVVLSLTTGCSSSTEAEGRSLPTIPEAAPKGAAPTVVEAPELAARVPAAMRQAGKLTIATDSDTPPMTFDGLNLQGVDIDLARATAQLLGLEPVFADVWFDDLRPAIAAGKQDVGWSDTTVTPERLQLVDFVSYYDTAIIWVKRTGSSFSPANLCGATVASHAAGGLTEDVPRADSLKCQARGEPAVTFIKALDVTEAAAMVLAGQVDAFAADTPVIDSLIARTNGQLEAAGQAYGVTPLGVVLAKGSQLGPVIRDAVQRLIDGGQYRQILDRWQVPNGAIKQSVLNPKVGGQ